MAPLAPVRARTKVHAAGDDRAGDGKPDRLGSLRPLPAREARAAAGLSVATATPSELGRLRELLAEQMDLAHAVMVLDWDSRVEMPPKGAEARAEVSGTISRLLQERFASAELGRVLEALGPYEESLDPDSDDAALIR